MIDESIKRIMAKDLHEAVDKHIDSAIDILVAQRCTWMYCYYEDDTGELVLQFMDDLP